MNECNKVFIFGKHIKSMKMLVYFVCLNVLFIAFLSLTSAYSTYDSTNTNVSACGKFVEAGTYTMNSSLINGDVIPSSGICMNIQVPNVILDCAGYSIMNTTTITLYGIYSNSTNTTIKNCNVSVNSRAAYLWKANNSYVYNSTFNSRSSDGLGLLNTNNSLIENITSNLNGESGIFL